MSTSLPERPDLDQLRRRAKELRDAARRGDPAALGRLARHHPSAPAGQVSLTVAQLVIARELGFSSWPTLKAKVDAESAAAGGRADQLVAASIDGRLREAAELLHADPGVAELTLAAAVVLGDTYWVRAKLATDAEAALAVDDERGWPPLLYACYSRWHQIDSDRAAKLAQVVKLLLDAGASPHTNNGAFRDRYRSALRGAVEVNNPAVVEVLLEASANPDDGRCIEQAADRRDPRCLELLLARRARVAGTWALGAAVYADSSEAVSRLLDALLTDTGQTASEATNALADAAAAHSGYAVVDVLLGAGANPNVSDSDVGLSAVRCAVRAGHDDTAALLVRHGADDNSTSVDRFIGACLAGHRQRAEGLLAGHPELPEQMTNEDRSAIVEAGGSRPAATIALMLDLGFSPHTRNGFGEQPLHNAAYHGNASVVRALLDARADVDSHDDRFEATPLAYATVGSGEQAGKPGDWTETVRLLVEAGASKDGVWVSDKPPSEEVMELLGHYGITPDEPADDQHLDGGLDPMEPPGAIGSGVMADVARHLEAAYCDEDFELLGSLLHPEVTWTGLCHNKAQVLDWYRGFQAEGTVATVDSVEVERNLIVVGLKVSRRAEGARPMPPQRLSQVCTIVDAQIVDIRFYPDRHSALGRVESGGPK